jgi:hypothetical protein
MAPLHVGFLEREFAQRKPPTLGQLTVKQELAFPPVRLAVETQLAVDLSAVIDEGPHAFARCAAERIGDAVCTNRRWPCARSYRHA